MSGLFPTLALSAGLVSIVCTPAREVRSIEELCAAGSRGEPSTSATGTVMNAPVMTWPGGRR